MKERWRRFLLYWFGSDPALEFMYPGLPDPPWAIRSQAEKRAAWYGIQPSEDDLDKFLNDLLQGEHS